MAEIALSKGFVVTVDDADLPLVAPWKWHVSIMDQCHYARRNIQVDRVTHPIYMHRVIPNAPPDMVVGHINHNGLNNRRSNLRVVSHAENLWNARRGLHCGVSWDAGTQRWRANISHRGKRIEIGVYPVIEDALAARQYMVSRLRGGVVPEGFDILTLTPSARKFLWQHPAG